jgi:glucokinase
MDATKISDLNTFLVLDAIRRSDEVTRVEVAAQLGLSEASISRIIRRLIADGSVEERPGNPGTPGRTPSTLRFVPRAGGVIAIDLGGTKCHGALADLAGDILHEDVRPTAGASDAAGTVLKCIAALRSRARRNRIPVRSIVVGIPALIDPDSGLAVAGPNVGWHGFDILSTLQQRLTERVEVDNDVNLAALGQAWRGEGVGTRSFVTLSLGTGIGGALVIDGRLVRGRHNAAGEVGQLLISRGQLRGENARHPGLERVASGPAIRTRAAEMIRGGAPSRLAHKEFDTADVFAAAREGDVVAGSVIEELLDHVAMAIINVTAIVDPDRVILDGSVGRALEPWVDRMRATVAEHVVQAPELVFSRLGPNGTVMGAVARGLELVSEMDAPATVTEIADSVSGFSSPGPANDHGKGRGDR